MTMDMVLDLSQSHQKKSIPKAYLGNIWRCVSFLYQTKLLAFLTSLQYSVDSLTPLLPTDEQTVHTISILIVLALENFAGVRIKFGDARKPCLNYPPQNRIRIP